MKTVCTYIFYDVDDPCQLPVYLALGGRVAAAYAGVTRGSFYSGMTRKTPFGRRLMCERVDIEEEGYEDKQGEEEGQVEPSTGIQDGEPEKACQTQAWTAWKAQGEVQGPEDGKRQGGAMKALEVIRIVYPDIFRRMKERMG